MPRGRRGRFAAYEELEASLPPVMKKRPLYVNGVGLFRGESGTTIWLKITLPHGGIWRGRTLAPGQSVEIKLGNRLSWAWDDVEAKRREFQRRADQAEPLEDAPVVSFAAYGEEWLSLKKPTARGWSILAGHVRRQLVPAFGRKALSAITTADVNRFVSGQLATRKPASVQRQLSTLKAILNHAVRAGILDRNPCDASDPIKGIEPRQRFLTGEELEQVFETADRLEREADERTELRGWLRHFVSWALHSGMRRSEILALRWGDIINMEDGSRFALVRQSKSGKPRYVMCTDRMLAVIEAMRQVRRNDGDDRLFPVSLTTAKRKLTRLWKTCGLDDVRLHDLRRTHASVLVGRGVDLRTVAGRLGHRDLAMLERHYAVFQGDRPAAQQANDAFGKF
jgi:integrase